MTSHPQTGIKRLVNACCNSYKGLRHVLMHEAAFRLEFLVCVCLLPVIIYVEVSNVEKLLLVFSLVLVLIVEVINTAIEAVVDRIGKKPHALSGLTKDLGSLAVLLSMIFVVIVWLVILL